MTQTLMPIVGIDLGMNKRVRAIFTPLEGQMCFRTIATNADELADTFQEFPRPLESSNATRFVFVREADWGTDQEKGMRGRGICLRK